MKLSEHFTLEELTFSDSAIRLGIQNVPGEKEIEELRILCNRVLEPLRDRLGLPIEITSGYRSSAVNTIVGGVYNSDHLRGAAADIRCKSLTAQVLMSKIVNYATDLPLKQVILEYGSWVHVSVDMDAERPELLVKNNGTPYTAWKEA